MVKLFLPSAVIICLTGSAAAPPSNFAGEEPAPPPATIVPATSVNIILFPMGPGCVAVTFIFGNPPPPVSAAIPAMPLVVSPEPAPYLTTDESRPLIARITLVAVLLSVDTPTST